MRTYHTKERIAQTMVELVLRYKSEIWTYKEDEKIDSSGSDLRRTSIFQNTTYNNKKKELKNEDYIYLE